MNVRMVLVAMSVGVICLGTTAAILYKSEYDGMRREVAELDAMVGSRISAPGIRDGTVVTADRKSVYVSGLDGARRLVLLRFDRDAVVVETPRIATTREIGR